MKHEEYISGIDAQLEWIAQAKEMLRDEAKEGVDSYWAHHFKANEGLDLWKRSTLGARVKKGAGRDFYIQWYWNQWYKDKRGNKHPLSQHIRKGKGFSYPEATLKRYAKEWEMDLVMSLEGDFAEIRKQARELKLAEQALRRLRAVVQDTASPDNANDTEAEAEE
ncbi:conjugative transfer protein MobI(A/C) [Modicisalibacter sp. MOD 31.J]|uniref:conjugative transfer protein MobI(A/C) n=1 Tax=Modicisalibacter sp. MOD 31.J TaxID=2831897 RepID=UPI001CCEBA7D|nr:conjugative transfer protein MobI(A/C) [Modicisalibacter sp. MOD 31.J]MBZ9574553.1 hypothetical protein [Modicisalibacter sp. MOD 31.J]